MLLLNSELNKDINNLSINQFWTRKVQNFRYYSSNLDSSDLSSVVVSGVITEVIRYHDGANSYDIR